jgi:hypothetical protein
VVAVLCAALCSLSAVVAVLCAALCSLSAVVAVLCAALCSLSAVVAVLCAAMSRLFRVGKFTRSLVFVCHPKKKAKLQFLKRTRLGSHIGEVEQRRTRSKAAGGRGRN